MSELFNRFDICSEISEKFKEKVKIFHVFDDQKGYNVLFTTIDDNVFSYGSNAFGCCGFGHNTPVSEPEVIPELCHKNIKQFFIGWSFVLGLTGDNQLYGWGWNGWGQLGRGTVSEPKKCFKPKLIPFPHECVIQISCGSAHSLALTSEGNLYGWGANNLGQIGCGKVKGDRVCHPVHLKRFDKFHIKTIRCSYNQSFALTTAGFAYSWGYNDWHQLGHKLKRNERVFEPMLINVPNISYVCPSGSNTYFMTNEGFIYLCGKFNDENNKDLYQESPKQLISELKFSSLHSIPLYQELTSSSVAISQGSIYELSMDKIVKLNHKTLFNYYCNEFKISYKTLCIDHKMAFNGNHISDLYCYENPNEFQNSFLNNFEILKELGSGGFGTVYEVQNIYRRSFAIKKIAIQENTEEYRNDLLREVNTLSKCSDEYVVHYFDSWIENYTTLYIRMELCSDNLQNIIEKKPEYFIREASGMMNIIEYFISGQLFQELLECVQYLHESNPPIIHRDLKPENILIAKQPQNGRYLKLCDFGCAKFDTMTTNSGNTRAQGTYHYMAPEVNNGNKYNTKADIYSLGLIAMKIFEIDVFSSDNSTKPIRQPELGVKYSNLENTIESMLKTKYQDRPTCAQILSSNGWSITKKEMNNHGLDEPDFNYSQHFFQEYMKTRISVLNETKGNYLSKFLEIFTKR